MDRETRDYFPISIGANNQDLIHGLTPARFIKEALMRAVVQKCNWCKVDSEGEETASISKGFVVLLGVKKGDTEKEAEYIADKILHLRIFEDENDKLNLSLLDVKGDRKSVV